MVLPTATPRLHAASSSDEYQDAREDLAALPDAPELAHLVPDTCSPDDAEPLLAAAQGAGADPNPEPDPGPAAALQELVCVPHRAAELGGAAGAGGLQDAGEWEEVAPMDATGGDDVAAGLALAELPGVGAGAASAAGVARLGGAAGAGGLQDAGEWEEVALMDATGRDDVAAGLALTELPGVGAGAASADGAARLGGAAGAGGLQDAGEREEVAPMDATGEDMAAGLALAELPGVDQPDSGNRDGAGAGAALAGGAHDLGDQGLLESGVQAAPGGAAGAAHGGADASGSESEGEEWDEFGLNSEERGYLDDAALWHAEANIVSACPTPRFLVHRVVRMASAHHSVQHYVFVDVGLCRAACRALQALIISMCEVPGLL